MWGPPSLIDNRKNVPKWRSNSRKPIRKPASAPAAPPSKAPQSKLEFEKKRAYDKPWQQNNEKAQKGGAGSGEKGTFLYHCYPDGVGPDSHLIEMLERDVVDKNPQVSFDDIADLQEAKNILQEAVLLPLLMP